MNQPTMDDLRNRYSGNGSECLLAFRDTFKRYASQNKQSLLDLTVVAANLDVTAFNEGSIDDPLALKAIHATNPDFDPHPWFGYGNDEWMGTVNSAKGKYFEYLVADRLNAGEPVGGLSLPPEFKAQLADSMTQPGWDMKILDDHGRIVDYLQLKATDSAGYIHDTLARYPDITILTTDEVAGKVGDSRLVLDSDISNHHLEAVMGAALTHYDDGFFDRFLDGFHPLLPLIFIAATQGYRVAVGQQSIELAIDDAAYRVARSATAGGVGALVYAIGGGWLSLPASFTAGLLYNRFRNLASLNTFYAEQTNRLKAYQLYQQDRLLQG